MKVFFCIVEVVTLLICVFFGYKWVNNPQGNYEPWLFLAGLIFIAFEVFRRYGETFLKKDGKIVLGILNRYSLYSLEKKVQAKFDKDSAYYGAHFYTLDDVKKSFNGKIDWKSILYAQDWFPSFLSNLFYPFENLLSKVPFSSKANRPFPFGSTIHLCSYFVKRIFPCGGELIRLL